VADGRSHSDFDLRLRQRDVAGRGARLLRHEPAAGLLVQACWATLLCLSGSYSQLLDYIMFAVLVFYILTIVGLFVLRFKRPDAPRPYKALGYPVLPALYIVIAAWICLVLLRYKPQYTWPGLVLVLLGIPVYLFWSRRSSRPSEGEPNSI
jgi:APA family basic amino acid/polyamine antiporter